LVRALRREAKAKKTTPSELIAELLRKK